MVLHGKNHMILVIPFCLQLHKVHRVYVLFSFQWRLTESLTSCFRNSFLTKAITFFFFPNFKDIWKTGHHLLPFCTPTYFAYLLLAGHKGDADTATRRCGRPMKPHSPHAKWCGPQQCQQSHLSFKRTIPWKWSAEQSVLNPSVSK